MASNLTRDEARDRAQLLSGRVLPGGTRPHRLGHDVRLGHDGPVQLRPAGRRDLHRADRACRDADHAERRRLSTSPPSTATGSRWPASPRTTSSGSSPPCAYSRTGEGLHRFTDPADKDVYLYSDLETFDAHRIYACFDQPDLKATFEFTVTGQDDWTVISNMAPDASRGARRSRARHAGTSRRRRSCRPTSRAIAAGPYFEVTQEHDGIPLGLYCRQSLASYLDPDEIFEITRQGFDYYHQAFGVRYPFGKYDQLFVPEFKAGAMENAGCVTFLEDYIFRSRVTDCRRGKHGRRRSCTRWPTCGSATWSPCGGGTTCG